MNREDISVTNFVDKVGKGTGPRYKTYITLYARNYTACIVRLCDVSAIERKLL